MSIEKFKEILEQCKAIAELIGATEEQAIKVAIERAKTELGEDYSGLVKPVSNDIAIQEDDNGPPPQPAFMTITGLERLVGMRRKEGNKMLIFMKFQKAKGKHYAPTDKVEEGVDYVFEKYYGLIKAKTIKWNVAFFKKMHKEYNSQFPPNDKFKPISKIKIKFFSWHLSVNILNFILCLLGYQNGKYSATAKNYNWATTEKAKRDIDYKKKRPSGQQYNIAWNEDFVKKVCYDFLNKFNQDEQIAKEGQ
jgi:hypothetical protein